MRRISRANGHNQQQIRRGFFDGYSLANNFVRQLWFGQLFSVLRLNLRNIDICSNFKRQLHCHVAIVCTGRFVIQQIINTRQLYFNRAGNCFRNYICTGTRIVRINLYNRWRNFRKLGNRKICQGNQADNYDDNGQYRCKNRPFNKKTRVHNTPYAIYSE